MRDFKFRFGFKAGHSIIFRHMTLDELLDCDNAYEIMNLSINEELSIEGGEDLQEFDLISKDEFTGLQDAIGVDIYKGDIIKLDWLYQKTNEPYCEGCIERVGVVDWNGRFVVNHSGLSFDLHEINQNTFERFWREDYHSADSEYFKMVNIKVISNIHQNPELLGIKNG